MSKNYFKVLSVLFTNIHNSNRILPLYVPKMPFYAVAKGKAPGIFMSWPDCEAQVKGFPGAKFKKFNTVNEAQDFINLHGSSSSKNINSSAKSSMASSSQKRPYSVTTKNNQNQNHTKTVPKTNAPTRSITSDTTSDKFDSDDSDDINDILVKQLDDIEKRIKGVEKNVNSIFKKSNKSKKAILIDAPPTKKTKIVENDFERDDEGFVHVYTDGACTSNGKVGAKAGLGVYWSDNSPLNISEPVSGRATNNCGEIQAATRAIQTALDNGLSQLQINTDSKFLINAVTKWIPGWKRKGWKLKSGEPVKNEIDFKELDSLQNKLTIRWNYVKAHHGTHGNEMADQFAKNGAMMYNK